MRLAIPILAALTLTGCVRTMQDVEALPITDETTTQKTAQQVRDCLVPIMDKVRARPLETGTPERRSLAFTGDTGTIALYILTPSEDGTRVVARRRKMISDNYEKARGCFVGN